MLIFDCAGLKRKQFLDGYIIKLYQKKNLKLKLKCATCKKSRAGDRLQFLGLDVDSLFFNAISFIKWASAQLSKKEKINCKLADLRMFRLPEGDGGEAAPPGGDEEEAAAAAEAAGR